MGRGDKRSRKGKIFKGSFGNSRPRKAKKTIGTVEAVVAVKKAAKPKATTATAETEKKTAKRAPAKKTAAKKADAAE